MRNVSWTAALLIGGSFVLTGCGGGYTPGNGGSDGTLSTVAYAPTRIGGGGTGETGGGTGGVGGGGGGNASACFDAALFAIGTRYHQKYRVTENVSGNVFAVTDDDKITQHAVFKGNPATELVETEKSVASDPRFSSDLTGKHYFVLDGTTTKFFGSSTTTTERGSGTTFTQTIYNNPAREVRNDLGPGESYTQTYTVTSQSDVAPGHTVTIVEKRTFVGQESVTVPAGTFADACKFIDETTDTANGITSPTGTRTQWFAAGRGLMLKQVAGTVTTLLLGASINGTPVHP